MAQEEKLVLNGFENTDYTLIPGYLELDQETPPFLNDNDGNLVDPTTSGFLWQDRNIDSDLEWEYSTANPHSGTRHIRRTAHVTRQQQENFTHRVYFAGAKLPDAVAANSFLDTGSPVSIGDEYTFSIWYYGTGLDDSVQAPTLSIVALWISADGNEDITESLLSVNAISAEDTWVQASVTGTVDVPPFMTADPAYVTFQVEFFSFTNSEDPIIYDLDDPSLMLPEDPEPVLYINNTGFRFPYSRWI